MKVLVVEKDELSARILARKLDNWGHVATVARNTFEAERLIERESYRLIITEIELPGRTGTEFVRFVRGMGRARYTYIMILTSVTDTTTLLEALEAGADDLLRKPLNVFEMRLRIKAAKRMLNMEDQLREGAGTDGTTGLVNLQSFRQFFRVILSENTRTKATGALMFIEVQNYYDVRESSGFQAAEVTVRAVSRALAEIVRTADLVARIDDATFCLCLQNTDWPTCKIVGDKVLARVKGTELVFEGHDLRPRVRIDTANFPVAGMSADEVLATAPRFPFEGGEAVVPAPIDPRGDHSDELVGADEIDVLPVATEVPAATANMLRRAGIDVASYGRLSEFEQRQVLKLAEQFAAAAGEPVGD